MTDRAEEFFDRLGQRGFERLLLDAEGTLRVDLERDEQTDTWFVLINKGKVEVAREGREADCIMRADRSLFEQLVTGEVDPHTAWLRNQISREGDLLLLNSFQRIFPGPRNARNPRNVPARGGQP
jgi:putative sterol carrier protein